MSATVKLRFVRHSSRKLQPVARMFRGQQLERAIQESSLMTQQSAYLLNKAFKMADSAAKSKEYDTNKLVISAISISNGPKIKRVRPNAKGRTNAYKKHLAHILVTVSEQEPKVKAKPKAKKATKAVSEKKEEAK